MGLSRILMTVSLLSNWLFHVCIFRFIPNMVGVWSWMYYCMYDAIVRDVIRYVYVI